MDNQTELSNIKVIGRFRPLNQKETQISNTLSPIFQNDQTVIIGSKLDQQYFTLDKIFNMNSTQQQIFEYGGEPVVQSVFQGFNGTILAYGQTSSGKTHTMLGNIQDQNEKGLIPRIIDTIFNNLNQLDQNIQITIKTSMVEIYKEKIKDLLRVQHGENLKIREDRIKGIYIENVYESYVTTDQEIYNYLQIGNQNKSIGFTQMNQNSSRSHTLFMMSISQKNLKDMTQKSGKLFLVDLAGSEKVGKTGAEGMALDEAKKINQSLSNLGFVINALTEGNSFIPYRNSKLTRILQESLGGNSKTTLIVTCSPSIYNETETITTLRFGVRAKTIKNKPKVNKELTIDQLLLQVAARDQQISIKDQRIEMLRQKLCENNIKDDTIDELVPKSCDSQSTQSTQPNNINQSMQFFRKNALDHLEFELKQIQMENEQLSIGKKELKTENIELTEINSLKDQQLQNQQKLGQYFKKEFEKTLSEVDSLKIKGKSKLKEIQQLQSQYENQQNMIEQSKENLNYYPDIKDLRQQLQQQKQQNQDLQMQMIAEEEKLRLKVNNLEQNIEQMANMYQQMIYQRQVMAQDYKNLHSQFQNQQKLFLELQNESNNYKLKYNQLKSKHNQLLYLNNQDIQQQQQPNFFKVVQRQRN